MLKLRPHHLIDIVRNIGQERPIEPHPYGHAQHSITRMLMSGDESDIMLVCQADDLCGPCRNLSPDKLCTDRLHPLTVEVSKQKYNDILDNRLFAFFGIEEGTVLPLPVLLTLMQSRFDELIPVCLHPYEDYRARKDGLKKGLIRLKQMSK